MTRKLSFQSPNDTLETTFYRTGVTSDRIAYEIVGVVTDVNIRRFHNDIQPTMYLASLNSAHFASVRISGSADTIFSIIERIWSEQNLDYPLQMELLSDTYNELYNIYSGLWGVLAMFALVTPALSLFGLFALSAYIAQSKTHEIGIRIVFGASKQQVVRFLIWKFTKPVVIALIIALPGAILLLIYIFGSFLTAYLCLV